MGKAFEQNRPPDHLAFELRKRRPGIAVAAFSLATFF
jgi:hypothetical protein